MKTRKIPGWKMIMAIVTTLALLQLPQIAMAHCDALDGPAIIEAREALVNGDVTPVLKWVMPEHEEAVRGAFAHTMKVRALGPEARDLADRYFFETVVRIHREGEGAPYTGIKPAGMIESPIVKADQALEQGSVEELANAIGAHVGKSMRERFGHALDAKKHADKSVEAGREFVEAYVQYVHFVEGIVGVVHGDHVH